MDSLEGDGVGGTGTRYTRQVQLLVESLLAETEDDSAVDTCIVQGVESGGDGAATIVQKCLYATKVIIFFDYNSPNLLFFFKFV